MAALHSIRMERFVRYLLETGVQSQAYLKAGYKANTRNTLDAAASRLTRSAKVKARIKELQGNMITRNRVTVDTLLSDLDEDRELARRLEQPSAAISATALKARLTGLLVDRKESGAPGEFAGLGDEAKVMAMVRSELGEDAAAQLSRALEAQPAEVEPELVEVDTTDVTAPMALPTHGTDGTRN